MKETNILLKNAVIILDSAHVQQGCLAVSAGKIQDIFTTLPAETGQFDKILDCRGKIIAPGLINGHTHSYANFFKTAADNLPLEEMMFYIMAEGDCLEPEDVYYNTMLGAIEMIRGGVTACLDQLAQKTGGLNAAMQAYEEAGMRATVAPMYSDLSYFATLPVGPGLTSPEQQAYRGQTAEELLQINLDFLKQWHGKHNRLAVGFGPSGPQRCSKGFLQACMAEAKANDAVFHTHALETRTQKNTAHLMFGKPMLQYLDSIGCLNQRLSMAHGVWITPEEAKLAADRGATVVHNPACNLYLGSGIAPVNLFRQAGLNVGLGTDGPNGGCNQSMLETMKMAGLLHRAPEPDGAKWVTAAESFRMATENNAAVIGLQGQLGKIAKGQRADIVVYNPEQSPALQPLSDPVMQIAFGETGCGVETVIIEGRVVLENNAFTTIDEAALRKEILVRGLRCQERLEAKRQKINSDVAFLQGVLPRDF